MLEDSVAAGDGGSGVQLLFDNHTNADFMQEGNDGSFMGSSKGSKSCSRASNSDIKVISSIALDLKQLHERSIALQKSKKNRKRKIDHMPQRQDSVMTSKLLNKRNTNGKCCFIDPTADAMQMFINNIGERLESKKRELDEFDEKMKSLNETPQKSNGTL